MEKQWRLVVLTRYVREKNNYKTEDVWTDTYDLEKGLQFYLPGHYKYKSYVKTVMPTERGVDVVLVTPVEYENRFSSEKPLCLHYSDYRESCGDGIDERWDVSISVEEK